ncbi:MAG TPA: phosphohydrolase, partial [Lentimicrobium sp.]|nr:phosphohydrolase [Lentimicrobium sp.]
QLVSSQLDMDRLDYLKRDSFYTGVSEGVISTDRIIKMLTVHKDELMVEDKGIYSIEKFIVARRLMYWQVYYHKTVVSAENMLINLLKRAKYLAESGEKLFSTPALELFLQHRFNREDFAIDENLVEKFALLDDYDIFAAIKVWAQHPDFLLSMLSRSLVNRQLFRAEFSDHPTDENRIKTLKNAILETWPQAGPGAEDYLLTTGTITNNAYIPEHDKIYLLYRNGRVCDIADASDQLNISVLTSAVSKHFIVYPKTIPEF